MSSHCCFPSIPCCCWTRLCTVFYGHAWSKTFAAIAWNVWTRISADHSKPNIYPCVECVCAAFQSFPSCQVKTSWHFLWCYWSQNSFSFLAIFTIDLSFRSDWLLGFGTFPRNGGKILPSLRYLFAAHALSHFSQLLLPVWKDPGKLHVDVHVDHKVVILFCEFHIHGCLHEKLFWPSGCNFIPAMPWQTFAFYCFSEDSWECFSGLLMQLAGI